MKTIIKAVSRYMVCVAARWRPKTCYAWTNVAPTFYVDYSFNLNDA